MTTISVYGQQGSRNLLDEYCKNNWQQDPTRCADYVPKDYQSQPSQPIQQNPVQSNSQNDANRICPLGSYLGKDAFGNQACLDSHTNQVVGSPNLSQLPSSSNGVGGSNTVIGIVVFIVIVIIIGVAKSRSKTTSGGYVERQEFSRATKDEVKERQHGRCAKCETYPTHWEFDHIGSRGDNSIGNCQGLCRDCHQDKTLKDNR